MTDEEQEKEDEKEKEEDQEQPLGKKQNLDQGVRKNYLKK